MEAKPTNDGSNHTPLDIEKEKRPQVSSTTNLCSCTHNLGLHQLRDADISNAEEFQRKHNLSVQAVNFIGAANNHENTTIQEKINEIKERLAEYSFDKTRIITIPNQVPLPKQPALLDVHLDKIDRTSFLGYHVEDVLHHQIINALHDISKDTDAFVMKGFKSEYCLEEKKTKAEALRKKLQKGDKKEKLKPDKIPPLNQHEEEILEMLTGEGENIQSTVDKLIQIHDLFKQDEKILGILEQKEKLDTLVMKTADYLKQNQIHFDLELVAFVVKGRYNL